MDDLDDVTFDRPGEDGSIILDHPDDPEARESRSGSMKDAEGTNKDAGAAGDGQKDRLLDKSKSNPIYKPAANGHV